ncbi:hypothetical protein KKF05_01315 [Patescibacteria group bacterium]|nr:hypothetical protein [Patescibacteria group bacterium]MBU1028916.1 hypothetical protein [Patescibacteria group bacterium]MBU1916147.1 hypothetical protein [Patescibacteria group bacterium]
MSREKNFSIMTQAASQKLDNAEELLRRGDQGLARSLICQADLDITCARTGSDPNHKKLRQLRLRRQRIIQNLSWWQRTLYRLGM